MYEVYPRSAADGNEDGIGDLIGLRQRLGHFTDLGIDALWLTPIYPSGGVDGGYDVCDFDDVDPAYGGLEALEAFIGDAHAAGLKVLLDFVPNHTSDRHPWFVEARSSRSSPKRDWYVWADPARDGGPPNNWLSAFGGPAWTFDRNSGQYYCTSFYPQQVDLNWRNPELRSAVTEAMRRWVDRGVDGFRIDVVMMLAKDPGLRDNRPRADGLGLRALRGSWSIGSIGLGACEARATATAGDGLRPLWSHAIRVSCSSRRSRTPPPRCASPPGHPLHWASARDPRGWHR